MFYLLNFLKTQAWKAAFQIALGTRRLQEVKGRGRIHSTGEFLQQPTNRIKQVSWNIKILLFIKEKQTSQVNEFSTFLWEDATVWDHWNHFFDTYLNHLGPYSVVFSSLNSLRVHGQGEHSG